MLQYKGKSNVISNDTSNDTCNDTSSDTSGDTSNIDMLENIIHWHEYPMVSILDLATSQYYDINVSE